MDEMSSLIDESDLNLDYVRQIIELLNDGIWVTDKHDIMVLMNKGVEHIAGVNRDQCIGLHVLRDFPEGALGEFKKYYQLAKETLQSVTYELAVKTPAGRNKIQQGKLSPIIENDSYNGMVCTIHDVPENTQSEHDIVKEKKRAERYLHLAGTMLISLNTKGEITLLNKKGYEILGYEEGELIGKNWFDTCLPSEIVDEVKDVFQQIMNGDIESVEHYDNPIIRKDGEQRLISWHNTILKDDDGDIVGLLSSGEDVTKLRNILKSVEQSEKKFKETFMKSTVGYSLTKPDGTLSDVNMAFASMLGYSVEELCKMNFADITHPDDLAESKECVRCLLSGEKDSYRLEKRYYHKNGSIVWTDVSTILMKNENNEPLFFITSIQNITEKKKADDVLKETLEATTDGIWIWNFQTETMFFSDRYYQMLGYEPQEFAATYENWVNLIHPEDRDNALEVAEEYLKEKPDEYENNFRLKTKQGSYRWIRSKARVVERDNNGEAIRMIGNHEDVTEKHESEKKLQRIFDMSSELICEADINTATFTQINPAFSRVLGYTKTELLSQSFIEFIHPDDIEPTQTIINEQLQKGEKVLSFINRYRCKDGSYIWLDWNSFPVLDEKKIYAVARDVTDERKKELGLIKNDKRLRISQKIARLGSWEWDLKKSELWWSDELYNIFNVKKEEFKFSFENITDRIHPDDREKNKKMLDMLLTEKHVDPIEFRIQHSGGNYIWVRQNIEVNLDKNGQIEICRGTIQDITQEVNNKKLLRSAHDQYHRLTENVPGVIYQYMRYSDDRKDKFNYISHSVKELYGLESFDVQQDSTLMWNTILPEDLESFRQSIKDSEKNLSTWHHQWRITTTDGVLKYLEGIARPELQDDGSMLWDGLILDITKRKHLEEMLKKSEEKYRLLTELANDVIFTVDLRTGQYEYISPSCEKVFGVKQEKFYNNGEIILEIIPKDAIPFIQEKRKKVIEGKIEPTFDFPIIHQQKMEKRWFRQCSTVIRDDAGKPIKLRATVYDISSEKKANEGLKQSEEKLRTIIDSSNDYIIMLDEQLKIQYINRSEQGLNKEDLLNIPLYTLVDKDDQQRVKNHLENVINNGVIESYETTFRRANGEIIYYESRASPLKSNNLITGVIVNSRDITEKKQIDKIIEESNEKFKLLFENSTSGVVICQLIRDEQGNPVDYIHLQANPACEQHLDSKPEHLINKKATELIGEEAGLRYAQKNGGTVLTGMPHVWIDHTPAPYDRFLRMSSYLIKDDYFAIIFENITERMKAVEKLKQSEEKYRTYINNAPNGVFIADKTGRYLEVNEEASKTTGYSKEELLDMNLLDLIPDEGKKIAEQHFQTLLEQGHSTGDNMFIHKDGSLHWWTVNAVKLSDDRLLGFTQDITDKIKAEDELRKAHEKLKLMNLELEKMVDNRTQKIQDLLIQKDEMINQMGHDLKNPLGPIINLMPILMKHENDPKKLEMMDAVHKSAEYMKNLVVKSIKLAKINSNIIEFNYEPVVLSDEISDICIANKLLFDENNIVIKNLVNSDFLVNADKLQFHELFNNLLNNAVKYSENGGTVLIQAQENDDMIHVSIKDQGIGMTEEQMSKIFDEFYKADFSRHDFDSSGLGMSICKRIVEKHGGKIWAESEGIGKGSTIHFTLPKKINEV